MTPRPQATPTPEDGEEVAESSWRPVDLTDVLSGTWRPPQPTVGERDDGIGLFYPGRQHTVASETEAGKTWFLLGAAVTELNAGYGVVFIDFEDDEGGIVGRLLTLGVKPDMIRDQFAYLRPDSPLDRAGGDELNTILGDLSPNLVVLDGVTEAMVLHGLNPMDNVEVAAWSKLLPGPLARSGAAVVSADHLPKDPSNHGRYNIGAQHKIAGLNGAAYKLVNRSPFGIGIAGMSTLYVTKDRPGQLRRHALRTREPGVDWFGDLVLTSLGADWAEVAVVSPVPSAASGDGALRPTVLMQRISDLLMKAAKPLSKGDIESFAGAKRDYVRAALFQLQIEGFVIEEKGDHGAKMQHLVNPFTAES